MAKLQDFIRWETHTTDAAVIGGKAVQLESQSLSLRLPLGGFVWHRPTAVLVHPHERIPIVDVTRIALWALGAATAVIPIIILFLSKKKK